MSFLQEKGSEQMKEFDDFIQKLKKSVNKYRKGVTLKSKGVQNK